MSETVLFVGGSADGKKRVIEYLEDRIDVPVIQGSPQAVEWFSRKETYIRQDLGSSKRIYPIYLVSTESPDNLIPLLIEGYGRKE